MPPVRRLLAGSGAVAAVAVLAIGGPRAVGDARVGSGYAAKTLCSGVFLSRRAPADVATDLPDNPMIPLIRYNVDPVAGRVTASVAGVGSRTAVHLDGLGCVLLPPGEDRIDFVPPAPPPAGRRPVASPPAESAGPPDPATHPPDPATGFDDAALDAALDRAFLETDPDRPVRTRAVVVVHDGRLVAERYAPGFAADMPLIGWSMAKSVTNALVGILVREGRLALTDTALYPGWPPGDPRAGITVDHLLRMSSGLAFEEDYGGLQSDVVQMLAVAGDMGAFAAEQPLVAEPGTRWDYSSGTANILSRTVRDRFESDAAYLAFPRDALFAPLGMESAVLEPDFSGTFVGSSFVYATARDWARFGELYLNDGVGDGRRILPEGWVAYTATPAPAAPHGQYGALFWLNAGDGPDGAGRTYPDLPRDLLLMSGHDGQIVAVVPDRDLVVVRLGFSQYGNWDEGRFLADVLRAFPPSSR